MTKAVTIAVRRRPLTAKEVSDRENVVEIDQLNDNVLVVDDKNDFVFDKIIKPEVTQQAIYDAMIHPMVEKTLNGFYCTVLAYGQTGTGKTYTMGLESEPQDEVNAGIIPRVLTDIFNKCRDDMLQDSASSHSTTISVSFIEIYTDKVNDLLSNNNSREQIFVKGQKYMGANMRRVCSLADAQKVLAEGNKRRHVRPTEMNTNSSRSHAIFTIKVERRSGDGITPSALHLVDLAGSEGVRRTNHQGPALNEGVHINQGLLCISKVIQALSRKSTVIPYRDSVLSSVLQDSLNAKSYLTLLACISPLQKDLSETLSTLRFARHTSSLRITPQINAIIAAHKKSKTPVKPFKTPMPKKITNHRLFPIAQSTAMKRPQMRQRSDSFTTSRRTSSVADIRKKPRVEVSNNNNNNRFDSFDDSSQTTAVINQMKLSGCSSLDSSLGSTTLEPVRPLRQPLPAIKNIEHLANPQPLTSFSPIVRRVTEIISAELDKKMNTMLQTFVMPVKQLPQTVQQDIPRSNPSNSTDLENTILISQKMDETVILPSEPEGICIDKNEPDDTLEITVIKSKVPIVYPYDSSIENSQVDESDCGKVNQTDQSQLSAISFPSPENISHKDNVATDPYPPALPQNGLRHIAIESKWTAPNIPIVVRRSRRLTILNERKKAKEDEERERNEFSSPLSRNRPTRRRGGPRVFKDVTLRLANATNTQRISSPRVQSSLFGKDINNVKEATTKNDAICAHRKNILDILNTGTQSQIQMLPQIGAKTAFSLITHRQLTGPFKDIESLAKLKFWSGKRFERFVDCNNL